jgi:hypothetical protein
VVVTTPFSLDGLMSPAQLSGNNTPSLTAPSSKHGLRGVKPRIFKTGDLGNLLNGDMLNEQHVFEEL